MTTNNSTTNWVAVLIVSALVLILMIALAWMTSEIIFALLGVVAMTGVVASLLGLVNFDAGEVTEEEEFDGRFD